MLHCELYWKDSFHFHFNFQFNCYSQIVHWLDLIRNLKKILLKIWCTQWTLVLQLSIEQIALILLKTVQELNALEKTDSIQDSNSIWYGRRRSGNNRHVDTSHLQRLFFFSREIFLITMHKMRSDQLITHESWFAW